MFTVRVVQSTDAGKPAMSRDYTGFTKNQALEFIGKYGKLSAISRMNKLYIITPSSRK